MAVASPQALTPAPWIVTLVQQHQATLDAERAARNEAIRQARLASRAEAVRAFEASFAALGVSKQGKTITLRTAHEAPDRADQWTCTLDGVPFELYAYTGTGDVYRLEIVDQVIDGPAVYGFRSNSIGTPAELAAALWSWVRFRNDPARATR